MDNKRKLMFESIVIVGRLYNHGLITIETSKENVWEILCVFEHHKIIDIKQKSETYKRFCKMVEEMG